MAEWHDRAKCKGCPAVDAEKFFGSLQEQHEVIVKYCNRCEVVEECAEAAVYEKGTMFGVRGAMTERSVKSYVTRVRRLKNAG